MTAPRKWRPTVFSDYIKELMKHSPNTGEKKTRASRYSFNSMAGGLMKAVKKVFDDAETPPSQKLTKKSLQEGIEFARNKKADVMDERFLNKLKQSHNLQTCGKKGHPCMDCISLNIVESVKPSHKIKWSKDKAKWKKLEEQMKAGMPSQQLPVPKKRKLIPKSFIKRCEKLQPPQSSESSQDKELNETIKQIITKTVECLNNKTTGFTDSGRKYFIDMQMDTIRAIINIHTEKALQAEREKFMEVVEETYIEVRKWTGSQNVLMEELRKKTKEL